MTTPTQGQLKVMNSHEFGGKTLYIVTDESISQIAHVTPRIAAEANASRLALCWNNHDELVQALGRLTEAVESAEVKQSNKNPNASFIDTRTWCGAIMSAAIDARAILAKVKGGE